MGYRTEQSKYAEICFAKQKNTISWRGTDNKYDPAYKTEILLCGNKGGHFG